MVDDEDVAETQQESGRNSTPRLSDDRLYRALASTQRRRLLCFLLDNDEATVDELATVLTGWNAADRGTMGTKEEHKNLSMALEHVHLPLLADVGMVSYDRQNHTASVESLLPEVRDLIRRSIDREQPSSA
jgi:DNA-binding transcriptional ArsR family regulator